MQVEGLSISAGLHRVPDVYILPTATPNAFAGGMDEKSAYIGVNARTAGPVRYRGVGRRPSPRNGSFLNLDIQLNTVTTSLVVLLLF